AWPRSGRDGQDASGPTDLQHRFGAADPGHPCLSGRAVTCPHMSIANLSYAHGGSSTPLLGETIGENLRRIVARHGARDALIVRSQHYRASYRALWEATTRAAKGLMALGVKKG